MQHKGHCPQWTGFSAACESRVALYSSIRQGPLSLRISPSIRPARRPAPGPNQRLKQSELLPQILATSFTLILNFFLGLNTLPRIHTAALAGWIQVALPKHKFCKLPHRYFNALVYAASKSVLANPWSLIASARHVAEAAIDPWSFDLDELKVMETVAQKQIRKTCAIVVQIANQKRRHQANDIDRHGLGHSCRGIVSNKDQFTSRLAMPCFCLSVSNNIATKASSSAKRRSCFANSDCRRWQNASSNKSWGAA